MYKKISKSCFPSNKCKHSPPKGVPTSSPPYKKYDLFTHNFITPDHLCNGSTINTKYSISETEHLLIEYELSDNLSLMLPHRLNFHHDQPEGLSSSAISYQLSISNLFTLQLSFYFTTVLDTTSNDILAGKKGAPSGQKYVNHKVNRTVKQLVSIFCRIFMSSPPTKISYPVSHFLMAGKYRLLIPCVNCWRLTFKIFCKTQG